MFENYFDAKKYYDSMVRCLSAYRDCNKHIIQIQKETENEVFIQNYPIVINGKIVTLEDIVEQRRIAAEGFERNKYKLEREFREKYGVQTSEELETKIRDFRPELKRLKTLELQKFIQKGMGRSKLRRVKKGLK